MDLIQGGLGLFFVVGVSILLMLLGREIVCWYWKVNTALTHLAQLETVLRNIDQNLVTFMRVRAEKQAESSQPE